MVWSEHADVAMVRPYKQIIRVGPIRELSARPTFGRLKAPGESSSLKTQTT
jgi:hypothetical protein